MLEKILTVDYPTAFPTLRKRGMCVEYNLAKLFAYYGKDFSLPLSGAYPGVRYIEAPKQKISEKLCDIKSLPELYQSYGVFIKEKNVTNWEEYRAYLENEIEEGRPVIVHLDCYYVSWDPYYKHLHNNHTVLIMGNRAEAFFLVDPYFDRAEWLEKETFRLASRFYYEINKNQIQKLKNGGHKEIFEKRRKELLRIGYLSQLELFSQDMRNFCAEKEFLGEEKFREPFNLELLKRLRRIERNKNRFIFFLREWEHREGHTKYESQYSSVLSSWQALHSLLAKGWYDHFSERTLQKIEEDIIKIRREEENFIKDFDLYENSILKGQEKMRGTIGYDAVMDILPYCNNKGLSFSAYSEIADCTGLGEYIYAAEVERLKSRGYFLLTEEKKDNIRCEGQRLSFPKMDEIKEVKLLITAEWGDYEVNFRIMYADGKHTANRSLLLFDWSVEEGRIPIGPTYKRINGKIEKFRETAYAEEVTISLDSGYGNATEIILPECVNVHVLAIQLIERKE